MKRPALLSGLLLLALLELPALADPDKASATSPPTTGPAAPPAAQAAPTPTPARTPASAPVSSSSHTNGEAAEGDASAAGPARGSVVSALAAVGFGAMVLGGVSLGVSIGFGAKYLGDRSAAYDVCAPSADGTLVCPASIERLHDTAQADGAVAITTLALGLAFAGLGTTLVIVDGSRPRAAPAVAVVAGPGALALRGTFE